MIQKTFFFSVAISLSALISKAPFSLKCQMASIMNCRWVIPVTLVNYSSQNVSKYTIIKSDFWVFTTYVVEGLTIKREVSVKLSPITRTKPWWKSFRWLVWPLSGLKDFSNGNWADIDRYQSSIWVRWTGENVHDKMLYQSGTGFLRS